METEPTMPKHSRNFSRYLPSDQQAQKWGWRLLDAGCQTVPANSPYPCESHPENYLFDTDGRRTLDEFQLIYINGGSGLFESRTHRETNVHAGQALLLFPGEWHRYRPDPGQAWTEYWLGFRGREAERIMATFFNPCSPVLTIPQPQALHDHFRQILHWLKAPGPGKERILASHIPLALALVQDDPFNHADSGDPQLTHRAKAVMLEDLSTQTDLQALAKTLGVSYTRFRLAFKRETGYSPRQYENQLRLNRARDLLLREKKSVSETAHALGYRSAYYFSRAFKQRFQRSPQKWVQRNVS